MTIIVKQNVLKDLAVKDVMRRQVLRLPEDATIEKNINFLIKYKLNALLLTAKKNEPTGVVSKTDIMSAYYASLPIESPARDIMSSPPLFCGADDSLESALDKMRAEGIYRLYARERASQSVVGVLAYPDVVGLLYLYCSRCEYSLVNRIRKKLETDEVSRFRVKDVMTPTVRSFRENDSLLTIMEGLSAYRFGAVLITGENDRAVGVVSKTDLILAYAHGVSSSDSARTVMFSPVLSCDETEFLEGAIRTMIFSEVHRLFVHRGDPQNIVG
ncbi:MAG: CBS domain-containing protein, partial [Desulforhabdus sp.]|nr:CBS domain-containing protein [Desulforhabdus sp.]